MRYEIEVPMHTKEVLISLNVLDFIYWEEYLKIRYFIFKELYKSF